MKKKLGLIILIISLLLIIIGFIAFNQFDNSENTITVGNSTFILPNGFHEGSENKFGDINITNGYDTLFLKECGDEDINKYINEYINNKEADNSSVSIKNFTSNNMTFYKSSVKNESNTIHYWFKCNGKVYTVYTWGGNNNFDKIVIDLAKS